VSFTSRRRVALTAAAVLSSLALAACGSSSDSSGDSSAAAGEGGVTLLKSGTLQVCTHLSYKPFQFKDSSGAVVGFDVDLLDLVAKKLNAKQEIVDIDFAQITSGAVFAAKKCDAAAAATTINDKRKDAILFSDPYFEATQALLVKKDSGIKDLAGLKGKKLGVQTDTTGAEYGEKNKDANGYEVVVFDYAKDNPTTEVTKEFNTGEQYGFMFKKDDANGTALAKVTNEVLTASKADGSYNDIYKKWFGVDAPK
jgi:polar amino acid transport system substrate-binding protein